MQRALNLALPRQGMDKLMQPNRGLDVGELLALIVEELQVGYEPEWIGHRDHTRLQPDPVPGDSCGLRFAFIAPERLAGAQTRLVAEAQNPRAEMRQVKLRRAAGLPQ